jgi:hypothetical protein
MVYIALWLGCALLGAMVGSRKGNPGIGFFLGLLFGPLGVLLTLLARGSHQCPHCKSDIDPKATTCPKCGKDCATARAPAPKQMSYPAWRKQFLAKGPAINPIKEVEIQAKYHEYVRAQKKESISTVPDPSAPIEDRLAKLQALQTKGLISETEFAERRKKILDEI